MLNNIYGKPVGDEWDNKRAIQAHLESEKEVLLNLYKSNLINLNIYNWSINFINKLEVDTWFI